MLLSSCMDLKCFIELIELCVALGYLLSSYRKETHLSQSIFAGMIGALACDVFWLHGHRSVEVWFLLNLPFCLFIYEKVFRKYCLLGVKKLLVWVALFVD